MNELTLSATLENVPLVTEFVDEQLETWGCSPKVQMQMRFSPISPTMPTIRRLARLPFGFR